MKKLLILLASVLVVGAYAQDGTEGSTDMAYMVVKSTTVCGMCKTTIETEMPFVKGVQKAIVNLEASEIAVDYNPKKTDKAKIRLAIAALGYQADDIPADPKAFKKLPECCQKRGMWSSSQKSGRPRP